jgi:hypothetical protein
VCLLSTQPEGLVNMESVEELLEVEDEVEGG